jgi:hypothetical protein
MVYLLLMFLFWASPLSAESPIHIIFNAEDVGKFPSRWQSRDSTQAAKVYSVQAEGEKKFLHADSKGLAVQIGFEKKWGLRDYPILQWQWRAVLFPTGSNEREKSGNDSVLGLYVVFGHWPLPRTIKYIWSDTLPVGASFPSPYNKAAKMIVIRSGRSQAGTWVQEKRNVLADYHHLFGEEDNNPMAAGLAILTDSDNTKSQAIGDYGEIQTLEAIEGSKVRH